MFQQPPTACTLLWRPRVFDQEPTLQVKHSWNTSIQKHFLHLSETRLTWLTLCTPTATGLTMHCLSLSSESWSASGCWSETPSIRCMSSIFSVLCHTLYKFIHPMNSSFNFSFLENPPSAPRHPFTCRGKSSHRLLNRFCYVMDPLICVISSSSLLFVFQHMESVTAMHMSCGEQAFAVQQLVTLTCE